VYIDTHVHLGDPRFDEDRSAVIARAAAAGVSRLVEIGDSPREWERSLALSREHPGMVRCALGIHPYHVPMLDAEALDALAKAASSPEVVAVGEFGLDYARCEVPKEQQRRAMRRLFDAAQARGLPVIIHCRDAYEDLLSELKERFLGRRPERRFFGVLHCFAGDAAQALQATGLGFALGVDGPVTYPKNQALRDAFRGAGLENLVLETDSPYLPPQSSRGKRNEPRSVAEIAAALAAALDVPAEKVEEETTRNARDLFSF